MKLVLIGAGNVATRLGLALQQAGEQILQIYNRSEASAQILSEQLGVPYTTNVENILPDADIYIFSLKDDVIESVAASIHPNKGLWVHTSGSVSVDIFKHKNERYGVLYPLQTFSKAREVDFSRIHCFVESPSQTDEELLSQLAKRISNQVHSMRSEDRKFLHLAAVFTNNFTNHLYLLAEQLLEEKGIPGEALLPLIDETAEKVHFMSPRKAQTGPAVRNDRSVMDKHIDLLKDKPEMQEIYDILSRNIFKTMSHE